MKNICNLFKWTKKHIFTLLVVLFLAAFAPFTYSYVPLFIKYIFDVVLLKGSSSDIALPFFLIKHFDTLEGLKAIINVSLILVIYQTLRSIILFSNGFFRGTLSQEISYDMRNKMYVHIQNLSYSYHSNANTGDLLQRCTSDIETVQSFLAAQFPQVIGILAQFTFGAMQLGLINIYLMLSTMVLLPISVISSIWYFKYVTKKFDEIEEVEAQMTTTIQENINGIRVVKAFNSEIEEINKFDANSKAYRNESQKLNKVAAIYWGLSDFSSFLSYAITLVVAIYLSQQRVMTTGDIIASLMYIGMLVWPIRGLGRIIGDFGKAIIANKRVLEVLETPDEYVNDGTLEPIITGDIEFRDVKYRYTENADLLNGVSFKIKAGQTIALVGKTGAGKSTVASLLTRLIDSNDGEILLDGVNIKDIKKRHVRENIGLVLQEPFLYTRSIYENISIARPQTEKHLVYDAATIATIATDINKFEKGYDTLVGEKGVTLSGGQKQRVAIARMLLLEKPVVIFDDSLSAVDTTTDLMIRQALKNRNENLTSIIITHRITTAKEADLVIVLDSGKVSQMGTHDELAKVEGLYKNLWDIQGQLEESFLTHIKGEPQNAKL
ncbi:MAG: ABC transporter ATP-binding protein [Acholeplasmataceae bacterium]|jgi:ATP-binding cassette subfamily B protein